MERAWTTDTYIMARRPLNRSKLWGVATVSRLGMSWRLVLRTHAGGGREDASSNDCRGVSLAATRGMTLFRRLVCCPLRSRPLWEKALE